MNALTYSFRAAAHDLARCQDCDEFLQPFEISPDHLPVIVCHACAEDRTRCCECSVSVRFADATEGEDGHGFQTFYCVPCEPQPCLNRIAWEASLMGDR